MADTDFETKVAVVVRDDLAGWQRLNVCAFLVSGVTAAAGAVARCGTGRSGPVPGVDAAGAGIGSSRPGRGSRCGRRTGTLTGSSVACAGTPSVTPGS